MKLLISSVQSVIEVSSIPQTTTYRIRTEHLLLKPYNLVNSYSGLQKNLEQFDYTNILFLPNSNRFLLSVIIDIYSPHSLPSITLNNI